ncbi:hypothetical protein [Cellulosimicrobium marinum]|uniref:hypothetical protein n=1 Tax=Cellulosimicrobium marinum TaxID=1638992 RepID=UPI001E54B9DA|nr:hypothetical protein [Cellulosimicrobium marinum]MCB7138029.1 hypothetical protein [Cellulosimicrobium marinum]
MRLTQEGVPVAHMVSVVSWFTCEACGERAAVVEKSEVLGDLARELAATVRRLGQSSSSGGPTASQ